MNGKRGAWGSAVVTAIAAAVGGAAEPMQYGLGLAAAANRALTMAALAVAALLIGRGVADRFRKPFVGVSVAMLVGALAVFGVCLVWCALNRNWAGAPFAFMDAGSTVAASIGVGLCSCWL